MEPFELRDELAFFEDLLENKLSPRQIASSPLTETQISALVKDMAAEKDRIRRCLKKMYYHPAGERFKEQYVQRHQAELVILVNTAFHYIRPESAKDLLEKESDTPIISVYKLIYHSLKELLAFIESHLTKYFNQEENAPLGYQIISKYEFQNRMRRIRKKLGGMTGDKEILQRVLATIQDMAKESTNVTYRKLIYARTILIEMEASEPEPGPKNYFSPLRELMFYMNFNCSLFAHLLIKELIGYVSKIDGYREKLLFLYGYRKELNQLVIKPGTQFRNNPVSLKEAINGWVEEEILFLEKTNALLSGVTYNAEKPIHEEDKLSFSVPVGVLSILGRSACDTRLVTNKNKKSVMTTIARLSKTVGSSDLQENSLLKKSYAAEPVHKERAIGILHEMIRKIHEY